MPPRVSVRRIFLCVLLGGGALLLLTLNQKLSWVNIQAPTLPPHFRFQTARPLPPAQPSKENFGQTEAPPPPSREENGREWFFNDGNVYPEKADKEPVLFPEQSSGDRVVEQLTYVPEDYQGIIPI